MYPRRELSELAARKAVVQARIAVHRSECVVAAAQIASSFGWVDRLNTQWRRLPSPLKTIGVPVALLFAKKMFPAAAGSVAWRFARQWMASRAKSS